MAGLGALLGGYGSDEDEEMEQQGDASPAGPPLLGGALAASPTRSNQQPTSKPQQQQAAAATAASPSSAVAVDSDTDTQGRQPLRVIDGPSTNPEPLPEGLSPPLVHEGLNGIVEEGLTDSDAAAAAANLDPKFLMLPPELREPPPGQPHPHLQEQVEQIYQIQQKSGRDVISTIRNNRRWNNPDFLEKMVNFWHLNQYGSSFSPEVWDPQAIPQEDYWPSLAQQLAAKKRQRGEQVKFSSAGQQQQPALGAAAAPTVAAAAAAAAVLAMGQAPGGAAVAGAPKMLPPDPRVEAAQAQAAALAKQLLSKKSKWDK